jgi:PAS domain S-box-containing protein
MKKFLTKPEWQVIIIYAIFGSLWIFLSDWLLALLIPDPAIQFELQHYKGLFFVFSSTLLIFFVLRNVLRRKQDLQERFQQIFEASFDAILFTSPDDSIYAANPAACRMFEMTEAEIIKGGREGVIDLTDPRLEKALEERKKCGYFFGELTFIRKNGEKFQGELSSTIFKDNQGNARTSMVIRDITDRKIIENALVSFNDQLEREIQLKTGQLEKANKALLREERQATFGRLSGGVAHELRNPLGVISNSVYYLRLIMPDASDKVKEYLRILENESQTAVQILNDLLNFANLRAGDRQPVSLQDMINKIIRNNPTPGNIDLKINLMENLPRIYVDPHQIELGLSKLIVNSFEAMEKGGDLTITAKKGAGGLKTFIVLKIQDTGPGVPDEDMKHLFEPLFTTKLHHIGLGLPLSRRLIEVNGGKLDINNESGKGVKAVVALPINMET